MIGDTRSVRDGRDVRRRHPGNHPPPEGPGSRAARTARAALLAGEITEPSPRAPFPNRTPPPSAARRTHAQPRLPAEGLIRRPRLLDLLRHNLAARGTLIVAPAGYGKTTLLAQFLAHLPPDALATSCWYTVHAADADATTFLRHLTEAVAGGVPGFGAAVLGVLSGGSPAADVHGQDREQALRAAVRLLAAELREHVRGGFVLVLDDCHILAGSAESELALDLLLAQLPDGCHLALAGRRAPSLAGLPRLVVQREVLKLDQAALALTRDETYDLVVAVGPPAPDAELVEALREQTGGWPMAVALAAATAAADGAPFIVQAAPETGQRRRAASLARKSREALFAFLAAEVLAREPESVQAFLLGASVLPEIEPACASALLGRSMPEVQRLLRDAEARALFVSRIDTVPATAASSVEDEERYRLHDLFRDFLLERLRTQQPTRNRWLQRRASALAETVTDLPQAVEHALAGRHFRRAARLIEQAAPDLIAVDRWQTLRRWLAALPAWIVERAPQLLVLAARVENAAGGAEPTDTALRRAETLLDGSSVEALDVRLLRVFLLRYRGEQQKAADLCRDVLSRLGEGAPRALQGRAHFQMAQCLQRLGQVPAALELYERAARLARDDGDAPAEAVALEGIAFAELWRGRLERAVAALANAQTIWRRLDNPLALARILNNLGLAHHYRGEYATAAAMFRDAAETARRLGLTSLEACAWLSLGDASHDQEALGDAAEAYTRGLALADTVRSPYLQRYATDAMGRLHRLQRRYDQAEMAARLAVQQAHDAGARYEEGLYLRSLALVHLARGEYDDAGRAVDQAMALLEGADGRRGLAQALLYRAQVAHASRRFADLRQDLSTLETTLRDLGYQGFLLADARRALASLDYGLSRNMGGPRLAALRDAAIRPRDGSPQPVPTAGVTAALQGASPPLVQAWALGRSRVCAGAGRETGVEWRGTKSKELLVYLLSQPGWHRREQIEADVWCEASETQARNAFHTNVHRLRRTLGAAALPESQGRYRLDPEVRVWFDVQEFERRCQAAAAAPDGPQTADLAQEALALYEGPFLADLAPEWARPLRDRLEGLYLDLCLRLGAYLAEQGQLTEAEALAGRALAVDPYLDPAHELLMRCRETAGAPAAALHHYHRYADLLQRELGTAPSSRMAATRRRIGRGATQPAAAGLGSR